MVTYEEIFAKIEAYIKKADPTKERKVPHTFLFHITQNGTVVRTYYLDLKNLKFAVGEHPADCTITLDHAMMVKLGTGAVKAAEAIAQGHVKVDGKKELAAALDKVLELLHQ
ncbi:uncharacterized protein LOC134835092 [Culicoides brevitarsis]|uniref:uncharacterized protein LOC134835092 n=1 Tax=Culicoides brevitarsis TaxID=469753 RepID=UPI00307BC0AE